MKALKFNNSKITNGIDEIITKGYTVKVGTVSGNSIEVLENLQSYVYYDRVSDRDSDLNEIKKAIAYGKV